MQADMLAEHGHFTSAAHASAEVQPAQVTGKVGRLLLLAACHPEARAQLPGHNGIIAPLTRMLTRGSDMDARTLRALPIPRFIPSVTPTIPPVNPTTDGSSPAQPPLPQESCVGESDESVMSEMALEASRRLLTRALQAGEDGQGADGASAGTAARCDGVTTAQAAELLLSWLADANAAAQRQVLEGLALQVWLGTSDGDVWHAESLPGSGEASG